jgi:hypothetical protein
MRTSSEKQILLKTCSVILLIINPIGASSSIKLLAENTICVVKTRNTIIFSDILKDQTELIR